MVVRSMVGGGGGVGGVWVGRVAWFGRLDFGGIFVFG